ncbi:MAG: DUF2846 domain-containing protein [Candidatus Acidiferrales bacterium]
MIKRTVIPLLLILIAAVGLAYAQSVPGCGPANVRFDVKTTRASQPAATAAPGKALVYFLQDDLKYKATPRPTTRFGIDGTWVGATHANSYFYVFVDPGEHHLCANWQSDTTPFYFGRKRATAATGFTAEAGETYYFRARDIAHTNGQHSIVSEPELLLFPVESDEAQAIMNSFAFSSFHEKK